MIENDTKHTPEEQDVARLLYAAGRRQEMPDDIKQRWEQQFRAQLAPVLHRRRKRHWTSLSALAASVALIALGLLFYNNTAVDGHTLQILAVSGNGWADAGADDLRFATPGQHLKPGTTVVTGEDSRMAVNWGGYDVRLNASSRLQLFRDHMALLEGEVYVSDEGRHIGKVQMTIKTALATIADIGTQFTVRIDPGEVISTVRRGVITVTTANQQVSVAASAGMSQQVTVNRDLHIAQGTGDSDWDWIYPVSSGFETEGQSVYHFLQWSVGESGKELQFATQDAEISARLAILSAADISSLDPEQAVNAVLASTRFIARREEPGVLLIKRRD